MPPCMGKTIAAVFLRLPAVSVKGFLSWFLLSALLLQLSEPVSDALPFRRLAAALLFSLFSLIFKRKGECFQRVIHFSVPFVTLKGKHPRKSACPYVIGDR